jgi:hypothetical protein
MDMLDTSTIRHVFIFSLITLRSFRFIGVELQLDLFSCLTTDKAI